MLTAATMPVAAAGDRHGARQQDRQPALHALALHSDLTV
jgi:hypothetical protein